MLPEAVLTSLSPAAPNLQPQVRRLILSDFRSYTALDLPLDGRVIGFTGDNGAGKTNLLEALSLFTPGRGLRRADLGEMARIGGSGGFAVSIEVETAETRFQFGTGFDPAATPQRRYRMERAPIPSARDFAAHLRIVWLTPAMDGLFSGPAGDRRRFLDRLVLAVDAEHGGRVNALDRALRNRNRLLDDGTPDDRWLDAAERELAETAVAVSAARHETVARLAALIQERRDDRSAFPWADLALDGVLEAMIGTMPALEIEDRYRALLRAQRARDAGAGRTLIGPQASDIVVRHGPKQADAARCSTGEQKALLIGLVLAHARLVGAMSGFAPLVLLDEMAAHFDPLRRTALFDDLQQLGSQIFITGADPKHFSEAIENMTLFSVIPGKVTAF